MKNKTHLSLRLPILPTASVAGESILIGSELAHLAAKLIAGALIRRHGRRSAQHLSVRPLGVAQSSIHRLSLVEGRDLH